MKFSLQCCPSRQERILSTRAHNIDAEINLWYQPAPVCNWECFGEACKCRLRACLVRLDSSFRRICAVDVGWCILILSPLRCDECLDFFGGFVVQFVQLWLETSCFAIFIHLLVRPKQFLFSSALDGDGFDGVGIINVENTQITHTPSGYSGEASCLITGN